MSGACCVDVGAKQTHTAQGHEEIIAGHNTYKTGEGKSVIVIFTDIFGYAFINTRKLADTFSQATGATVLIPDFFNGDPIDATLSTPVLFSQLPAWLKKHPVDQACAASDKFILSLKDQYQSIQTIGFCYGAKQIVHFITQPNIASVVKASVFAHPSFLVKEEAAQIKQSVLFLCAENDFGFVPELREHFEKVLAPTGLATFIEYPGTNHGFVVRPDGSEQEEKGRDKAVQNAIEFFIKNI